MQRILCTLWIRGTLRSSLRSCGTWRKGATGAGRAWQSWRELQSMVHGPCLVRCLKWQILHVSENTLTATKTCDQLCTIKCWKMDSLSFAILSPDFTWFNLPIDSSHRLWWIRSPVLSGSSGISSPRLDCGDASRYMSPWIERVLGAHDTLLPDWDRRGAWWLSQYSYHFYSLNNM